MAKGMQNGLPTFIGKQFLLGRFLVIDAIESKAEFFGLVLRIGYPHNVHRFPLLAALCAHNSVLVQLLIEERPYARNNPDRHGEIFRQRAKEPKK
jgi:hypothetical protein